jgi:hypothetical protein
MSPLLPTEEGPSPGPASSQPPPPIYRGVMRGRTAASSLLGEPARGRAGERVPIRPRV